MVVDQLAASAGSAGGAPPATCSRRALQAVYAIPGFRAVSRRTRYQFTILRLVSVAPAHHRRRGLAGTDDDARCAHDELLIQR